MIIQFNSDAERVQACHSREESISKVAKSLNRIIEAHRRICTPNKQVFLQPPLGDCHLIADVLEFVITDVLHMQAEQNFLFQKEMREGDGGKEKEH